jgi:hypothetical protein
MPDMLPYLVKIHVNGSVIAVGIATCPEYNTPD